MQMEVLSVKVKPCIHCKEVKSLTEFKKRGNYNNNICKVCNRTYMREYSKKRKKHCVVQNTGRKRCNVCHRIFNISRFPVDKTYKTGRGALCAPCKKIQQKATSGYYINIRVGYANNGGSCTAGRKKKIRLHKLTTAGIRIILEKQKHRCIYCGVLLDKKNLTLDHRIPLSRYGHNLVDNIDCTCYDCNILKHARTKKEFLNFLKIYIPRIQAYQCEPKASRKKLVRGRD